MSVFTGTVIDCDCCGNCQVRVQTAATWVAIKRAREAGWYSRWDGGQAIFRCPGCIALDAKDAVAAGSGGEAR